MSSLNKPIMPVFEWHLEIPYIFMDAEPTSTGLNQSECDGNSVLLLMVNQGDKAYVFSRRFLWCSSLSNGDFNVAFTPHPEYEWNENSDLTDEAEAFFEMISEKYKDELDLDFDKLSDEIKASFRQEHANCFEC